MRLRIQFLIGGLILVLLIVGGIVVPLTVLSSNGPSAQCKKDVAAFNTMVTRYNNEPAWLSADDNLLVAQDAVNGGLSALGKVCPSGTQVDALNIP